MKIIGAKLLGSWPKLESIPDFGLPELALIGRSNSGKSTFLNLLVGRKALAKVSATPGKTRLAVLFEIELVVEDGAEKKKIILVDLPGFGYAKVSKDLRQDFRELIVKYISKRKALKALGLLNDCRRSPSEDEEIIWQAGQGRRIKCALIVSKTDKLGLGARKEAVRKIGGYYPGAAKVIESGRNSEGEKIREEILKLVF